MASKPAGLKDARVLAFGAALSLLMLVMAISPSSSEPDSLGTSLDYGFAGHRALFEFLGETGHNPERLRVSPAGFGERGGTLWMIRPDDYLLAIHERALFSLGEWVEAGNHVILIMGDSQLTPLWLRELNASLNDDDTEDVADHPDAPLSPQRDTEEGTEEDTPPISGLALLSEALGVPLAFQSDWGREPLRGSILRSSAGEGAETTLDGFYPLSVPFGAEALWSLQGEAVILRSQVGAGTVTWVGNGDITANEHIGEGDHAWLLAGLMVNEGPVYIDEFFHGLPEYQSMGDVILRPPFRAVTFQALLLLGMVLWYLVPRFGSPRDPLPQSRRQKREHIDAMANLLARADDGSYLIEETSRFILADARQRLGLSSQTPEAIIIDALRARRPEVAQSLHTLLADGRSQELRRDRASLLKWGRRADTLRSTLQEVQQ